MIRLVMARKHRENEAAVSSCVTMFAHPYAKCPRTLSRAFGKSLCEKLGQSHGIEKRESTAVRYFNVGGSTEDIEAHNLLALPPDFRNTKPRIDGKLVERSAGKFSFHDNIRRRIALDVVLFMSPDYRRGVLHDEGIVR